MEQNKSPYGAYEHKPKDTNPKPPKKNKTVWIILLAVLIVVLIIVGIGIGGGLLYSRTKEIVSSNSLSNEQTDKPSLEIEETPHQDVSLPQSGQKLTSVQVAQKMMPSVVAIVIYQEQNGRMVALGSGSGVVMTKDGYILTCSHVVNDGMVDKIDILFTDGNEASAKLVGFDTQTDLAVIKTDKKNLTPAEFGDSNETQVGQPVYVIGSPSGVEYIGSFAGGYVSAVNREITVGTQKYKLACIQTDAAINPGNSGGPLINEYGQVIGINSAKLVSTNVEGMGFSIPINTAQSVIASLMESGYVTGRPKIGITFTSISKELAELTGIPQGMRVVGISEDCDVAKKNVKIGDIITAVDGKTVTELNEVALQLNKKQPGDSVTLSIYRVNEDGTEETFDVDVVLSEKTN